MIRALLSAATAVVIVGLGAGHAGYAKSPPARTLPAATPTAVSSPTPTAGTSLSTKLTGASETPPNKSPATGTAKITVGAQQVCWSLSVQKLQGSATQAAINRAPAGQAGPTVLHLSPPTGGSSHGCKKAGPPLARGLVKHPDAYYVNVHTSKFPNGEIRGQL